MPCPVWCRRSVGQSNLRPAMTRLIAVILFCAGIFCLGQSHAQVPMTGAGLGKPGGATAYTGPGDCSGCSFDATAKAWWGLRCYSNAYSGNVADVVDHATHRNRNQVTMFRGCGSCQWLGLHICYRQCLFVSGNDLCRYLRYKYALRPEWQDSLQRRVTSL